MVAYHSHSILRTFVFNISLLSLPVLAEPAQSTRRLGRCRAVAAPQRVPTGLRSRRGLGGAEPQLSLRRRLGAWVKRHLNRPLTLQLGTARISKERAIASLCSRACRRTKIRL